MVPKTTSHHNLGTVPGPGVDPSTVTNNVSNAVMHNSLYWGHDALVVFSGWPGIDPKMYALAVVTVFVLAVIVEWLTHLNFMKLSAAEKVSTAMLQTIIHTVRTGLSYMVMLAVMSFNGGIFLAAVGGHAMGFVVFRALAKRKSGDFGKVNYGRPTPVTC